MKPKNEPSNKDPLKMNFKERRYTIEHVEHCIGSRNHAVKKHKNRLKELKVALKELIALEKAEAQEGAQEWIAKRLKKMGEQV